MVDIDSQRHAAVSCVCTAFSPSVRARTAARTLRSVICPVI